MPTELPPRNPPFMDHIRGGGGGIFVLMAGGLFGAISTLIWIVVARWILS